MFANLSKKGAESKKTGPRKIFRKPLDYLKCRNRCLIVTAVILFGLIYLNYADSPVKGRQEELTEVNNLQIEEKLELPSEGGLLGGPINLDITSIATAQAAYDFTIDDEAENADFAILQGSGLLSEDTPNPANLNPFGGFRRETTTYTVKSGDTPFDIAIKFDINTDTILWANNLKDGDLIRPGDKLLILPINGVRIKIGTKDTVAGLAKKYSGKAEEIIAFNELLPDASLKVDSYIIIPNGETPLPPAKSAPKVTAPKYATQTTPVSNWLIAPTTGKNWGRVHGQNGVDISNVCGTPVYAAAAGKIILSDSIGWNYGYGKYIEIQHENGVVTLYAHSSQLLVSVGDEVSQGQLIMLMGTTGHSTGCHVHFEVRGAKNPLAGSSRQI